MGYPSRDNTIFIPSCRPLSYYGKVGMKSVRMNVNLSGYVNR